MSPSCLAQEGSGELTARPAASVRPILFSGPMVRALIEGRKTQTRRILKVEVPASPGDDALNPSCEIKHPHAYLDAYCNAPRTQLNPRRMSANWCWWTRDNRQCLPTFNVKFAPGDRLWVRESHLKPYANTDTGSKAGMAGYIYRADGPEYLSVPEHQWGAEMKWRPSIHMPREASRLTLTVTDVRVQHIQDIRHADAKAEGVAPFRPHRAPQGGSCDGDSSGFDDCARCAFKLLWAQINGPQAWFANPWVVAVTFTVEQRNVDCAAEGLAPVPPEAVGRRHIKSPSPGGR